jgi:uncharacterized membrane protein YccC
VRHADRQHRHHPHGAAHGECAGLLSLALACWVGLCLYVSLLDRTPRSYVFMLAGYTAGLIGFRR